MSFGQGFGAFADGLVGGMQMGSAMKDLKSKKAKEPTIKDDNLASQTAQNPPVPQGKSISDSVIGGAGGAAQAPTQQDNQPFSLMAGIVNQVEQGGGQMNLGPQPPMQKTIPQPQMPQQNRMVFSLQ